ncbi:MAG TPA: hypothetical protein DCE23_03060 [Firmicutes bacterium]|nr:hypothetical protein [Bacillota bacterium]
MGLLKLEKRNGSSNKNNVNNKGKYMNFDVNQMPQPIQNNIPKEMVTPSKTISNDLIDTIAKNDEEENRKKLMSLPKGATKQKTFKPSKEENVLLPLEKEEVHEKLEEDPYQLQTKDLNPLDNATNPIPVNPIAPVQDELVEQDIDFRNVKANLFSLFGMVIGMIFKPGTTIINNAKKYRSSFKALLITGWITILSLLSCLVVRLLVGSFSRTSNPITGASHLQFNPALLFQPENYVEYLAIAFIVSAGAILVMSLVYYASSFLNSKGVPLGSYITISNLSLLPFIAGVVIAYPIANIFAKFLAIAVVVFTFLYSLITFFIGMNRILEFKNVDRQILYNVLNLSVIIMIMLLILIIMIKISVVAMPDLVI